MALTNMSKSREFSRISSPANSTKSSYLNRFRKPKGLYLMDEQSLDAIYGPQDQADLARLIDIEGPEWGESALSSNPSILRDVEIIMASWGVSVMDEAFLAAAPNLRAVFFAAGSLRIFTTPAFWERKIIVSSAYSANAIPVSEYALAVILLSLKKFWSFSQSAKQGTDPWGTPLRKVPGNYGSTVGFVSMGMIARKLIQLLKSFDLKCIVYCPFLTDSEAADLGVERCSLSEVFRRSDAVSLHTPWLPETTGLITGELIASMKEGATLVNTARGAIIRESEMTDVLRKRKDLTAILDVCCPEPPVPHSALLELPTVILTPHIAGSLGNECGRLGRCMVDELRRYLAGEPLQWQISEELAAKMA
jgi:phosphoglycerate dehydrogenase-like enzyme